MAENQVSQGVRCLKGRLASRVNEKSFPDFSMDLDEFKNSIADPPSTGNTLIANFLYSP